MMTDINLNLYRVFLVLAKSNSFVEASGKLHISQPAVSKHIKNLEESLKTKLFYRDKTGINLTKDGRDLLKYVENSYNSLIAGQKMIYENQNLDYGSIIIGAPSHIASFYLMKYIKSFRKDYPNIFIRIISGSTSFLIEELIQHKIDFIIDSSPIEFDFINLVIEKLVSFKTCFITNRIELLNKQIVNLGDYNYIMPYERSSIRKNLERKLKQSNQKLHVVLEVETTELIIDAVKNDVGIGYVVKESVLKEIEKKELFELKIKCELPELELNLVYISDYLTNSSKKIINDYIKKWFFFNINIT
ncbi:MAG: LysR family transcriptional regulator [Malacoplasma sp.]